MKHLINLLGTVATTLVSLCDDELANVISRKACFAKQVGCGGKVKVLSIGLNEKL